LSLRKVSKVNKQARDADPVFLAATRARGFLASAAALPWPEDYIVGEKTESPDGKIRRAHSHPGFRAREDEGKVVNYLVNIKSPPRPRKIREVWLLRETKSSRDWGVGVGAGFDVVRGDLRRRAYGFATITPARAGWSEVDPGPISADHVQSAPGLDHRPAEPKTHKLAVTRGVFPFRPSPNRKFARARAPRSD